MLLEQIIRRTLYQYLEEKGQQKYKKARKYSQSYGSPHHVIKWGSHKKHLVDLTKIVTSKFAF